MVSLSILLYISSALSQQYFLLGCRIQDEVQSALNSITEVVEAVDKKITSLNSRLTVVEKSCEGISKSPGGNSCTCSPKLPPVIRVSE